MNNLTKILIVVDVILISPILYFYIKLKIYAKLKDKTLLLIRRFGFLISLIGDIGGGKTSGQSALTHGYTVIMQQDLVDKMVKIKTLYKHIDFNDLDDYIYDLLIENVDIDLITNQVVSEYRLDKNHMMFTDFAHKKTYDFIKDYVKYFYVLNIRNNYVYSVTDIYNRITNTYNQRLNLDHHKIHEAYRSKAYNINDFSVELIDEASDELASGFWRDMEKDESGAKEYRRKYRHIHEETNRMIDTRQDASDQVRKLRNLTQTHLEMVDTTFIFNLYGIYKFIYDIKHSTLFFYKLFKLYIPYFFYRLPKLFSGISYVEYYDKFYGSLNKVRDLNNELLYVEWFLKSFGYVRFTSKKYLSAEDVGKTSEDKYSLLNMFFPVTWCFGTYKQFQFRNIQEELIKKSTLHGVIEINPFDQHDFFTDKTNDSKKGVDSLDIDF